MGEVEEVGIPASAVPNRRDNAADALSGGSGSGSGASIATLLPALEVAVNTDAAVDEVAFPSPQPHERRHRRT